MLEAFKNILKGDIEKVDNTKLYPLTLWFSSYQGNVPVANYINKHFFYVKPKILMGLLSLVVNKQQKWLKYPKALKENNKQLDIIKPYIKKIYKWSDRVFNCHKHLINEEIIKELNKKVGFEKNECKTLGLNFHKFKVDKSKIKEETSKGLFDKW